MRAFKMGRKKNNQVQLAIANYDNFTLLTQLKFLFHYVWNIHDL